MEHIHFEAPINKMWEPNGRASMCQFLRPVMCHVNNFVKGFRFADFVRSRKPF